MIAANLLKDSDLEKIFEYIDKMPGGKIKFPVILALSLIFKSIKDINEERRSEEIDCYSEPKIMEYLSNYLKNDDAVYLGEKVFLTHEGFEIFFGNRVLISALDEDKKPIQINADEATQILRGGKICVAKRSD